MADVTITLTQAESNFVNYIIDATVVRLEDTVDKAQKSIERNGSLAGHFGERIKESDQASVQHLYDSLEIYREIRDKFPVDELD